ncbi:unnamed protein product [Caenorhabditis angaria]|uniref:Uncharacterized protein n=1 Tax=Caenorhabditis angaria TaxID=860376 RepID=A0A9P1I903_9PELO|nr:unnamed protein product [Caenorhabditis angaria]
MQIQLIPNENGVKEWMAIELHGTITPQNGEFDEKTLGTICWCGKSVFMIIGNQTLEGKITKIDRPLLVLHKSQNPEDVMIPDEKIARVEAIVRQKLIFKIRPRPLVISATSVPVQ